MAQKPKQLTELPFFGLGRSFHQIGLNEPVIYTPAELSKNRVIEQCTITNINRRKKELQAEISLESVPSKNPSDPDQLLLTFIPKNSFRNPIMSRPKKNILNEICEKA